MDQNNFKFSFVYRFFCWCSGARLYILKNCRSEYNKYFGIGIIVFLTGLLAAFTGGYALYTIFENQLTAIFFGFFWGLLIFFIDWYIISSLKKENEYFKELLSATPRLILAVFLAIIISKPLELKLFEKEINQQIAVIKSDKSTNFVNQVFEEFDEIKQLEQENDKLFAQVEEKEKLRSSLFEMIVTEAEGRSPTQRIGKGPVYKEKKLEYDQVTSELNTLQKRNNMLISQNNERITQLRNKRQDKISQGNLETQSYDGLLARLEALGQLTQSNRNINFSNWFIIVLFIIIESSPIIVKLMSKRGPYDEFLDVEEGQKQFEAARMMSQIESLKKIDLQIDYNSNELRLATNKKISAEYFDGILKTGYELNHIKIQKWKEAEMKKIDNKPEEYFTFIESIVNKGLKTT